MKGAYPLSPMQSGMLYQSLLADGCVEQAGYNVEQIHVVLEQALQPTLLKQAWAELLAHHEVLSHGFQWRDATTPLQYPSGRTDVPVSVLDWSVGDVAALRAEFLKTDRERGFDLSQPPLMRVTMAMVAPEHCELFWTFHYILIDGRVFAPLLQEVLAIHDALAAGEPLPALSISRDTRDCCHRDDHYCDYHYRDYIDWLQGRDHAASLNYFRTMLAGKHAPTPLPLAEPASRPLPAGGHGEVKHAVPASTVQQLRELARLQQTTMGGVVQLAWALLLMRLTGDNDVVFGITRSCRYSALDGGATDMIGLMINTLPARVQLHEQAAITELLAGMRQQWLAQREHDQAPLMDVQAQSELPPGTALFDSLLMYDNRELNAELQRKDGRWMQRHCELHEQPGMPLSLIITDGGPGDTVDALRLRLLFDQRRFTQATAARLVEYLTQVLQSLCVARVVADVQVLPDAERHQVVHEWNDTAHAFDAQLLIHQLFEARVDARPRAIAVEVQGRQHSFAEVEARANRLAHVLRSRGARPGCYVGVCLSRGVNLIITLLAIAKSGAAYVPIDPDYPQDRIAFMLADTQAVLVVTESQYHSLFKLPALDVHDAAIAQASSERLQPWACATDTCYAIYTSGSTGQPKGVVLTHRAVVNTLQWVSRSFAVRPGDRALFVTSPCFDLSVYDVFGVLGAGGTVVVATGEMLKEPRQLINELVERRITIWDSAPPALQRLAQLFPKHGGRHLRLVMLSGDWIPLTLPDAVRKSFPAAQVKSLGGATEAAIWSNWFDVQALDSRWTSIPYGRPIQNAQYYVLDKRLQPVPVGVTGDLYIAGACLAEGYLNRAELTAERFIANPFCAGERMYMTGDLARFFADGNIEFLGRADFQVKVRGYRIELGEIEAATQAIEGVRDALCTAYDDVSGAKSLVLYFTARDAGVTAAQVCERLRAVLPDFMVPARIMLLPAMPLSANGKIDRKALPSPLAAGNAQDYLPPHTEAEIRMAAIWQRLLKRDQISCHDSFFALGGDSLLAVSLAVEVERVFDINFPLMRVLEQPTLAGMAASLQLTASQQGRGHLVTLNAAGSRPPLVLFCGVGGFGFFFHDLAQQLGPEQPVHVVHAIGADDDQEQLDLGIEQMAAIYVDEITAASPSGPLVLGGYSFGAMVAFEVTRQLQARGRTVLHLISFDGPAPGYPTPLPLLPRLLLHVSDWWRLDAAAKRGYLLDRVANLKRRFAPLEADARLAPDVIDPMMKQRLQRVAASLMRARARYAPAESLNINLLLLKAEVPYAWPGCMTDELYGWRPLIAGDLNTAMVPGDHHHFFGSTNNAQMARVIENSIDAELASQFDMQPVDPPQRGLANWTSHHDTGAAQSAA